VFNLCHAARPRQRRWRSTWAPPRGSTAASYSASKFAVRGLTEALEWREHGIRVGDLMPPFVDTPMLRSQAQRPPVMRRLGVRLPAEQIAESAWKQAHASIVHRPVGLKFGLLFNLGQVTPGWINRLLMGWFSRP
jgi:NAD(P)-dependent dehydrogenase (short-subunit alcohol dehydrogenase family)